MSKKVAEEEILELFTVGIVGSDITLDVNKALMGSVEDIDNFLTEAESDAIAEIVHGLIERMITTLEKRGMK